MNEQIPILYYDLKTISPEMLMKISEGLKGFFGFSILLPKEVDLTYMDKNELIKELQDAIDILTNEDKKEE